MVVVKITFQSKMLCLILNLELFQIIFLFRTKNYVYLIDVFKILLHFLIFANFKTTIYINKNLFVE